MIRKIAILTACALVAACQTGPVTTVPSSGSGNCTEPHGPASKITIKYGDSKIEVTNRVTVKKSEYLKLTLNPDNSSQESMNYTTLNVYLFGATPDAQWLTKVYNAGGQNLKTFNICTNEPAAVYKYSVVIPGVGTIDPRVEIEN